ncbi:hypothetical protein L798_15576 [Zootermopsis nevadensis]|uniref:Uncharacterized protein n=1 Tax=Zootermopsis nevadensis TaxID=136037 RepID=A0A067RTU6_ZOONE|nr:hypothetical protein L798_15576 [Zootermopsis nevadensis]
MLVLASQTNCFVTSTRTTSCSLHVHRSRVPSSHRPLVSRARADERNGDHTVGRKKTLGRPRRRWEDDIKVDITEGARESADRIHLAQDRDVGRALTSRRRFPIKSRELLDQL